MNGVFYKNCLLIYDIFFLIHCVYAQSGADYENGLRPQFLRFEAHNLLWQWAIFARFGTIKFYNDFPIFS